MRARLPVMPRGRPLIDLPADARRRLVAAGRKRDADIERARARYAEVVAELVDTYGAGAVGRALGISRQSVHAAIRREIGHSGTEADAGPRGRESDFPAASTDTGEGS